MNNKATVGLVFVTLAGIIISGFILATTSDIINDLRVDLIEKMNESPETSNILMRLIVYVFMPYMWFMYIALSVFFLIFAVNQASRQPF